MEVYEVKVYEDRVGWYQKGKRHRLNGPAIEYEDGYGEYWVDGKRYEPGDEYRKAVIIYKALQTPEGQEALRLASLSLQHESGLTYTETRIEKKRAENEEYRRAFDEELGA